MRRGTRVFLLKKLLELLLTAFLVTMISFVLMQISPVDAAQAYVQRHQTAITPELVEQTREEMGLNDPLPVQYGRWLQGALHLDFGTSYVNRQDVFEQTTTAFAFTAKVVLLAGGMELVLIVLIGSLCYACRRKIAGALLSALCFAAISIPPFFLASSLIDIFAMKLGWISVVGNTGLMRYLPAAVCFTVGTAAFFAPLLATNIEKEMELDSADYARCRGLSERRILLRYAMPTAIAAILPSFFQMLALSLAGAIIVEQVFSLPGLGYLIMSSVTNRDPPVVHATILFLALALSAFNILSDVLRRALDRGGLTGGEGSV